MGRAKNGRSFKNRGGDAVRRNKGLDALAFTVGVGFDFINGFVVHYFKCFRKPLCLWARGGENAFFENFLSFLLPERIFRVLITIMITYTTKLAAESQEDFTSLMQILEWQRFVVNEASKLHFDSNKNSIVDLHAKVYKRIRASNPEIPSQVIIRAEQECLGSYRSARSNKHHLSCPIVKRALSSRLDKRLYSKDKKDISVIKITTASKRKRFRLVLYPRLETLLKKYTYKDPQIFVKNGEIWIALVFDTNPPALTNHKLALGVDLGIRIAAACSDGRIIIDRKFNAEKRRLRHLKRCLQSKGSKSSFRKLKSLRRKERNKNKNQTHLLANCILRTPADTIALENLKGIKAKKNKYQNKNCISQVPLFDLRTKLTYKALLLGKRVVVVNPAYTSQTDSLTGKREGERKGRRFYTKNGLVLDADLNAARNIGQRSKLPVSYGNILDGQALVNVPIVGACGLQAATL